MTSKSSMLPIALGVGLLSCLSSAIGGGVYQGFIPNPLKKKKDPWKEGDGQENIIIGAENYKIMGTENYVTTGDDMMNVPYAFHNYQLYAYNPNSTTLITGIDTFNKEEGKCPDGTLDCLYFLRVENGRAVDITDKNGNKLIQKFVDDLYDGKLPMIDEVSISADGVIPWDDSPNDKGIKLSENNIVMRYLKGKWVEAKPGENMDIGLYLISLMALYKKTGRPKPNVVIDIPALKRPNRQAGVSSALK